MHHVPSQALTIESYIVTISDCQQKGSPPLIGTDFLLHFLSRCSKLRFYSLGTHCKENMGSSEGKSPLPLGFQ
jgi:hypothetical protein